MAGLLLLIAGSLANLALALLVYVKNPKHAINRAFAAMTLSLVGASVATYSSLHSSSPLPFVRLTMIFAVILVMTFRLFGLWFPDAYSGWTAARKKEVLAAAAVTLIMLTPLTFSGVHVQSNGNVQPVYGPGIVSFFAFFVYTVGGGLLTLIKRAKKAVGKEKAQLMYLILATVFLFGAELIGSMIVPLVFKVSVGVSLSSVFFALFAGIITVAIVKRQLFDIRAVVARSVAYMLLLFTLVALYAIALFLLSNIFFSSNNVNTVYQMVNVILAILLAFTFPYLKQFFDNLTQRIFYRNAYDPQLVLDTLSEVLVRTAEFAPLKTQTARILKDVLKPAFLSYALFSDDSEDAQLAKTIKQSSPGIRGGSLIDVNEADEISQPLSRVLKNGDIALAVNLHTHHEDLGYLILGYKQSGEIYSSRDKKLLSVAADEIAIGLQNALRLKQIENFNRTLQLKINEATRKLRRSNLQLQEMDEAKDEFISMASHQLRTPLTSVKGYLSMLLEGDAGKINQAERNMLNQAFFSSQRMVYIIADLLNVSRLKTGKFVIEPTEVNLAAVVGQEIEQLKEMAAARSLSLSYDEPAEFPKLMLDETKTRQVIMNFIDNAIYYTPAGGHIKVSLENRPQAVEFRVKDDGIGVPGREQPHLFTKFYRAGNARKARPDGTGLGLFMAKKIVVAQHGSIIFESTEGRGSTFGFLLNKSKIGK